MVSYFQANLKNAFVETENMFNRFRDNFSKNLEKDVKEVFDVFVSRECTPIELPVSYTPKVRVKEHGFSSLPYSRVPIILGNGFLMKFGYNRIMNYCYTQFKPIQNFTQKFMEEDNVRILRKYGFTSEHNFLVPEHKVIGIYLDGEKIKVDTKGWGITITEDLSENGICSVVDFSPKLFSELQNGEQLRADYERHINALLELYHNPKIEATVKRHGHPDNSKASIERMLLVVIKENAGKLAIADLNNLVFDEV